MEALFGPILNLTILIALLYKFLKKPVRTFVAQRHETIRSELEAVVTQLRQAQNQFEEFTGKLKAVDAEIAAIRDGSRRESVTISQKVVSDAQSLSQRIVSDARRGSEGMYAELQKELKGVLAQRVLDRAEDILREKLTGTDRERIRREFSMQMETVG